jgi:hypothetical protein
MRVTIIVTDVIVRFRLAAIEHASLRPQAWQLEVITIEEVAHILVSLGFLSPDAAAQLTKASTTITPQQGITTFPFADLAEVAAFVHPEEKPPSLEALQSHVLIAKGETTEEALARSGFVLKVDGPLQ